MKLITPEIVIDKDDPFKNDLLDRKPFAESLTRLITNVKDNLVMSLDAQWGDGKTTFVKMWQGMLQKDEIENIYFDAFANDYFDNPFVALVSNITTLLEKAHPKKAKLDDLKIKASKAGAQLLSLGARVAIKAATLGVIKDIDIDQLKTVAGDIAGSTSNFASKIIEEKLQTYKEDIDAIEEFRKKLSELAEEAFNKKQKPLVFIIDELDRCKPTYALELIEKVKHLFTVDHIVFVLVMHTEQLEESVRCIYGQNIDARMYLQKFISIECKLPKNTENVFKNDYTKYCTALLKAHELDTGDDPRYLQEYIESLARGMRLSLRDLQRCYTNLVLFYSTTAKNMYRNDFLLSLLVVLKVKKPVVFEAIKNETIPLEELLSNLKFEQVFSKREDIHRMDRLKTFLRMCLLTDEDFEKLDQNADEKTYWSSTSFRYGVERRGMLPYLCGQMVSFKFL